MKAITLFAFLIVYSLVAQWISGSWRYCQYSNGEVHAVPVAEPCPFIIFR